MSNQRRLIDETPLVYTENRSTDSGRILATSLYLFMLVTHYMSLNLTKMVAVLDIIVRILVFYLHHIGIMITVRKLESSSCSTPWGPYTKYHLVALYDVSSPRPVQWQQERLAGLAAAITWQQ